MTDIPTPSIETAARGWGVRDGDPEAEFVRAMNAALTEIRVRQDELRDLIFAPTDDVQRSMRQAASRAMARASDDWRDTLRFKRAFWVVFALFLGLSLGWGACRYLTTGMMPRTCLETVRDAPGGGAVCWVRMP